MRASKYKQWKQGFIGLLLLGSTSSVFAWGATADSLIVASDLVRIKNIVDLQVQPDGSELAYAVREIVADTTKHASFHYETSWYIKKQHRQQRLFR
jgi:hypothetical protein